MAVAADAAADAGATTTSLSFSHTCGASASALYVAVTGNASLVTGVTYNGVAMTLLVTNIPTYPPGTNCPGIVLYGLNSPSTGANNVVVTLSASGIANAMSISYTGVKIASSPEAYASTDSANIQSTGWSSNITTLTNNALPVMFVAGENFPRTFTAGANTSVIRTVCYAKSMVFCQSSTPANTPGSKNLAVDYSGSTGFSTAILFVLAVEETPLTKTETVTLVPSFSKVENRFLTEVVTIVEIFNKTINRLWSEVLAVTSTLANIKGTWYQVAYTEAITVTGSIVNSFVFFITAVENLSVTDAVLDFAKKLRGLLRGKKNDINTKVGVRRT